MRRITLDAEGKLRLPPELCRRYQLDRDEELLLGKTETGLVLHTLRPDVRKVYLEVTTRCNLRCHTCVRNVWSESPEDMTNATFDHVVTGMQDLPDIREVVFGGYGEPFAHPRILDS